jgi:hypothetical protein
MDRSTGHLELDNATCLLREIEEHDWEYLLIRVDTEGKAVSVGYEYCKNRMDVLFVAGPKDL